jgi:Fructose/tagatose bisphosphate aldolase
MTYPRCPLSRTLAKPSKRSRRSNRSILVEGEVENIGTGSEIHESLPDRSKELSTPEEERQFVDATVVAPSVGNRHGVLQTMVEGNVKKRQAQEDHVPYSVNYDRSDQRSIAIKPILVTKNGPNTRLNLFSGRSSNWLSSTP